MASRLKVNWAAHGLFYLQSPLFHPITTPPQAAHITSAQSRIHGETVLLSCSAENNNSCSGRDRSDCFLYFHITSISPNLSEVKGWGDANWGEPTKGGLRNSLKVNILLPDSNWMKLGEKWKHSMLLKSANVGCELWERAPLLKLVVIKGKESWASKCI